MNYETPVDALAAAIEKADGMAGLASKLRDRKTGEPVSGARVWNWINRDFRAPAEFCPDIEEVTGITCEALRPDVNWGFVRNRRDQPKQKRATPNKERA